MPFAPEDQELIDGFLTESTELLEKLDDDLVALEKAPSDMELLNGIFRSIHTIKGASSFLGFDLLVKVTHKTEDVLNRLRKGELVVNPEIMDVILEAVDLVKVLVGDIKAGEIVEREIDVTVTKLQPLLSEGAGEATVLAAPQQVAPPASAEEPPSEPVGEPSGTGQEPERAAGSEQPIAVPPPPSKVTAPPQTTAGPPSVAPGKELKA